MPRFFFFFGIRNYVPHYHYTQENLEKMAKNKFWSPEMVNDYRDRVFANTAAHRCELKAVVIVSEVEAR